MNIETDAPPRSTDKIPLISVRDLRGDDQGRKLEIAEEIGQAARNFGFSEFATMALIWISLRPHMKLGGAFLRSATRRNWTITSARVQTIVAMFLSPKRAIMPMR